MENFNRREFLSLAAGKEELKRVENESSRPAQRRHRSADKENPPMAGNGSR